MDLNFKMEEEKTKVTREKFKRIKYVLDQMMHCSREMALSITVKKIKLRATELISAGTGEYIRQLFKENKVKMLTLI